jgi:hypothetical protein
MLTSFDQIQGSTDPLYRRPQNAKLVTPDIALHAYHKFFEATLEELEQHELTISLKHFLTNLYNNLQIDLNSSTPDLQDSYQRLLAQVTIARVLLENQLGTPPTMFDTSEQETAYWQKDANTDNFNNAKKILALYQNFLTPAWQKAASEELFNIYKSNSLGKSPLFGVYNDHLTTDYTQFTPRSHYTKNSSLRAYFRTMMYLGRSSYNLQKDLGFKDSNLLTQEFLKPNSAGETPLNSWQRIMNVTSFYAGQSDDLTYYEWQNFLQKTLNKSQFTITELANDDTIQKLTANLNNLRQPKILSEVVTYDDIANKTKAELLRDSLSFRIFGQRFTFDAWILNNLTGGQEATSVPLPSTPTALFVPTVFGNQQALSHTQNWLKENNYSDSDREKFNGLLADLGNQIKKVKPGEWFGSLQSAWLYVLTGLTNQYGAGYPVYMQSLTFADKQIQTFLGSYTELKHDTLLYAKQSYAELGGGGGEETTMPPIVKGLVEPNVLFWRKLLTLVDYNQKLFKDQKLFLNHTASERLKEFKSTISFYLNLSEQELQGKKINDDDYEKLRRTNLAFMAQPFKPQDPDVESSKVGLIADIHTDALKQQILYEATAEPYLMIALVGNDNSPRAVIGLTYNHYELTGPIGKRLTDEDWKKNAYANPPRLPEKNTWYNSLLVK